MVVVRNWKRRLALEMFATWLAADSRRSRTVRLSRPDAPQWPDPSCIKNREFCAGLVFCASRGPRCILRCVAEFTKAAASLKNYSDSGKVREENIFVGAQGLMKGGG